MPIKLSERPHPRDLPQVRSDLLAAIAARANPDLDAADVGQLPLAWVQLLIAAARSARAQGLSLTIVNPSFGFLFSFEALGLRPEPDLFTLEYTA